MSRRRREPAAKPALLTGTSAEYLGRRPSPRILRDRYVVVVIGDPGVGKTSVAMRLAGVREPLVIDCRALQDEIVHRTRQRQWNPQLLEAPGVVLDGPMWLRKRPAAVTLLVELLRKRAEARRRTLVCQNAEDGSIETLLGAMEAGSLVTIGLRFPKGPRGRLRFARRVCDELGLPRSAARGTETLEPWGYAAVREHLERWEESGVALEAPRDAASPAPPAK